MNINGITHPPGTLRGVQDTAQTRVERERAEPGPAAPSQPAGVAATQQPAVTTRAQPSLPAEPPPGTDPELWSILSAEERVYFAKLGAMGPLTYGRISTQMQAQPPVARGGRLNVTA